MKFLISNNTTNFLLNWLLFFALSIFSRLPHYLSESMSFDIDEAVIGIMAQDFLETGKLPYYFYLQNYGFSSAEVLSCSIFILIFGNIVWSLKLGGLLLFSVAVTFLFKLISNSMDKKMSYLFAILIVCFPSWYLWGGMLRGGYITSFVMSSIIFYLINSFQATKLTTVLLVTLLFYLGYDSHSLIILGLVPIIFIWFWDTKTKYYNIVGFFALLTLLSWLNAQFLKVEYYGNANSLEQISNFIINFKNNVLGFHASFTNFFSYNSVFNLPKYWYYLSWLLMISIFLTIIFALFIGSFHEKIKLTALILGAILSLLAIGLSQNFAPRYLLGFWNTILFAFIYAMLIIKNNYHGRSVFILTYTFILCFIGITTGSKMQRHWYTFKEPQHVGLSKLHDDLTRKGVKALVGNDNVMIWNFIYGESIPCVHICGLERTDKYKKRVSVVYKNDPSKVAVFGYNSIYNGLDENKQFLTNIQFSVAEDYYYYISPSQKDFNKLRMGSSCDFVSPLFE